MNPLASIRDHYLPPDAEAFRRSDPSTGRLIVIAPTRAACETIELAMDLRVDTLLGREHGGDIRDLARRGLGFGIMAGTGTGKTLAIRPIAEEILGRVLKTGVVNREREATPETPTWNVVIVTTGIARRWFQDDLIQRHDTIVVDEIHQTSAELELCLALGKRVGCRFIWLSATVDPSFYGRYLSSSDVLETAAFDPTMAARVTTRSEQPLRFLDDDFIRRAKRERRGVAVFLPTRAEVEDVAATIAQRWKGLTTVYYHGGQPIRVIRPFLDGTATKPFVLAMTAAGQSALNIQGLDTVVIHDSQLSNVVDRGRNVLMRQSLGVNELLQMAGRVHGRVPDGEVYILTDRDIDFDSLSPVPPVFQLAGDSERVALTAAAIGVDLSDLDLPVALDRDAYRAAVQELSDRGLVENGRLTRYGRDVESMPVDRPWGELLVQARVELIPFIAVMSNVDSLHRMTRDESDLRGLVVVGSDHLTVYCVFAEAVNRHGYMGEVFGLPRHLFGDMLEEWAEQRGVLVKAIEDIALGVASVYRTLELPLPERFAPATSKSLKGFRDLVARTMPFDLVIDGQTADGSTVKVSRGSVCNRWGAVAGTIRYFADRSGTLRAAIEGTNLPLALIQRHAQRNSPTVEYRRTHRGGELHTVYTTEHFGFVLDRQHKRLTGNFPSDLADGARRALASALLAGTTNHPHQERLRRALDRLGKYWRRSGGKLPDADPTKSHADVLQQLDKVESVEQFNATPVKLDVDSIVPESTRLTLDALPASAMVYGDRVPLDYEIEDGEAVVRLRLRKGQARRLTTRDLPEVDRPLRLTVIRGKRPAITADNLEDMHRLLAALPAKKKERKFRGKRRLRRRRH